MYSKECISCGIHFETDNYRKAKCKKDCGRFNSNQARNEKAGSRKELRSTHFKCGRLREMYSDGSGKCKHCRKLVRFKEQLRSVTAWHSQNPDRQSEKAVKDAKDRITWLEMEYNGSN